MDILFNPVINLSLHAYVPSLQRSQSDQRHELRSFHSNFLSRSSRNYEHVSTIYKVLIQPYCITGLVIEPKIRSSVASLPDAVLTLFHERRSHIRVLNTHACDKPCVFLDELDVALRISQCTSHKLSSYIDDTFGCCTALGIV